MKHTITIEDLAREDRVREMDRQYGKRLRAAKKGH